MNFLDKKKEKDKARRSEIPTRKSPDHTPKPPRDEPDVCHIPIHEPPEKAHPVQHTFL